MSDHKQIQFSNTRSILLFLIIASWVLLVLTVVAIIYNGFNGYASGGQTIVFALLYGIGGAVSIAVLSSIFVGVICLIDMRNIAAQQNYPPQGRSAARHHVEPGRREVYFGDEDHSRDYR